MKKTLCLCLLALGGVLCVNAQTTETVSVNGSTVNKFVTGITANGDNATLTYSDGTSTTADMDKVNIDLSYQASLSDDKDASEANAKTLANFGGKTITVNVARTLTKGQWNVFCVPFNMTSDQITAAFGDGTRVALLDYADNGNINFATQSSIKAGAPYLISPANTVKTFKVENAELKNLTKGAEYAGSEWTFVGTIAAETPSGNIKFLANGNKLYNLPSGGKIYPLRAYLKGANANAKASTFSIDGDVTGIMAVVNDNPTVVNTGVYTLQGQYLGKSAKGLAKGVYIINGKKQIVK